MLDNKLLQQMLKLTGDYSGAIDGRIGPKSQAGVVAILAENHIASTGWSAERRQVAAFQAAARQMGIDAGKIDGLIGPQTLFAIEQAEEFVATGKYPAPWRNDGTEGAMGAPRQDLSAAWPRSLEAEMNRFYGAVGTNQTSLQLPWPMKIAWNTSQVVNRITCHEKVHDSVLWVLEAVANEYSEAERARHGFDMFGGCLNVRRVRGGSAWSVHSWGAALDFDPVRNQLRWGRDLAYFAKPVCDAYRKIWSDAGALSLGEARNYDWMHWQFARL